MLDDPEAVRIYESIDYDFERSFGRPDGSHPMRSLVIDDALRGWLKQHPEGTVVELASGLETQFQRCDNGRLRWLCVDVPEAIDVRERFFPATERCRHVRKSALDPSWMDEVDPSHGVFVTAQGLLMYCEPADVQTLLVALFDRFPGVELMFDSMFDSIPTWFSQKTLRGFGKTKHYRAPPMPWGVNRDSVEPLLRGWSKRVSRVTTRTYGEMRGVLGATLRWLGSAPVLRNLPPAVVHVCGRARPDRSQPLPSICAHPSRMGRIAVITSRRCSGFCSRFAWRSRDAQNS